MCTPSPPHPTHRMNPTRFADPGYYEGDPEEEGAPDPLAAALPTKESYQHIRALPAQPGAALLFTHRLGGVRDHAWQEGKCDWRSQRIKGFFQGGGDCAVRCTVLVELGCSCGRSCAWTCKTNRLLGLKCVDTQTGSAINMLVSGV